MNNKPIELVRAEFIEKIVDIINSTELPAFVMVDGLKDILSQLGTLANQQYENAKKEYEEKEKMKA